MFNLFHRCKISTPSFALLLRINPCMHLNSASGSSRFVAVGLPSSHKIAEITKLNCNRDDQNESNSRKQTLAPLPPSWCRQAGKPPVLVGLGRCYPGNVSYTRQVPEGFPNTPRLLSHPAQHLLCFPVGLYFGAWSHAPCYVCEVLGQGSAAGALDVEDIQLHAFVNLVFEPWARVCHCPLLTTAGSEHARNRRHLCRGIICSPYGESSVQVGLSVPG